MASAMAYDRIQFRVHAIKRMFEKSISETDIRDVLESGEIIDTDRSDPPCIKCIHLGRSGDRPIHVVAVDDPGERITTIITVYEPSRYRWEPGFRRRRKS